MSQQAYVRSFSVRAKEKPLVHNLSADLDSFLTRLQSNGWEIIDVFKSEVLEYDYPEHFNSIMFTVIAKKMINGNTTQNANQDKCKSCHEKYKMPYSHCCIDKCEKHEFCSDAHCADKKCGIYSNNYRTGGSINIR